MRLRKTKDRDPATRKLEEEGLLKFKKEKKRGSALRKVKQFGRITYDFWSGVKYIVVLSALLWWIPLFGPMLAGYVGGRRTGGPKKGLFASIVSLGIIASAYYLITQGYVYFAIDSMVEYPDRLIGMAMGHSFFGPYLAFVEQYWTTFFDRVWAGVPFDSNSYVLTVIFAYIGGIISHEKRKEFSDGINSLDSVKEEISSVHRYAKNPMNERRAVNSAGSSRLQEMRPVRYGGDRHQKRQSNNDTVKLKTVSGGGSEGRREDADKSGPGKSVKQVFHEESSVPRSSVRHHSSSNGDDWEFL